MTVYLLSCRWWEQPCGSHAYPVSHQHWRPFQGHVCLHWLHTSGITTATENQLKQTFTDTCEVRSKVLFACVSVCSSCKCCLSSGRRTLKLSSSPSSSTWLQTRRVHNLCVKVHTYIYMSRIWFNDSISSETLALWSLPDGVSGIVALNVFGTC